MQTFLSFDSRFVLTENYSKPKEAPNLVVTVTRHNSLI